MDIESSLVAKAIASGDLHEVHGRGIEPEHFADDDVREIYEWSLDFLATYQQPPSMAALREEFPGFKPKLSKEPTKYHIERFTNHVRERVAVEAVRAYHDLLEDPDAIKEIEVHALDMAQLLVDTVPAPKVARLSDGKKRREEYYRRKKEGIKHGVDIGIPTFDQLTLGQQPHELVIWGGPPGGGKTTMMQFQALTAYFQMNGAPILFISLEVEEEQILRKFDVMMSNIRYRALKALELDTKEERKWTEVLERCERERMERDILIRDNIKNCTAAKVALEQMRYKAGMVFVDYLEEMRGVRGMSGWENVQENGRLLKQQARVSKVPYVTATQLNRDGDTAYQSVQKIADMLIVIQPPEEDDEDQGVINLMMRKYRDGPSRRTAEMDFELDTGKIGERGVGAHFPKRSRARGALGVIKKRTNGNHAVKSGALSGLKAKRK